VLHCPFAVGRNPPALARAERELGLDSRCVTLDPPPFRWEVDEVLAPDGHPLRRELGRWRLLLQALRGADVVHFNFGSSITPQWSPSELVDGGIARRLQRAYARLVELRDLPVLKRAGKAIFVTYQGDDARQGDVARTRFAITHAHEVDPGYYHPQLDRRKRRAIAAFDRYADGIYALNPDLLHFLPRRAGFMPYAHVEASRWPALPPSRPGTDAPVVLHAPTDRAAKGTRHLLEAAERLRAEGVALELVLVEDVPYEEALRLYERADLLVDQVLTGWYGAVAVELMALAKPVVAYIREEDLGGIPAEMRDELPIINATPATLADVLRSWLTERRPELAEVGRRSRAFVERWHDPTAIAARLKADYERALGR
jgi:glycosyltransferase involved in cell wall biosynthesis